MRGTSYSPSPLKIGESVVGRAVRDRKPYPVSDIAKSHYKFPELAHACQLRSMLSVPIIARERVLGGITVYSRKPHRYNSGEIDLLTAIAGHAAIAIENANLYRDSLNALFTLAKTIEAKDTYTQGHSERVTRVAAAIADGLKLPPEQVNLIRQICPLHDLGKIGISERVLRKKGKLTPQEWVQIRRHPLIGADILGPIRLFGEGICVVRNHHERVDGKGYPDGLAGNDIPLLARIACIADAFDAMTSSRPYRKGMPLSEVLDEIRRCSGAQFDRDISELFIDMVNKGGLDPNLIIVE
jgi:HD-GYP domain-containing protein (c-di-GMP phosphodiesterase class II)